MHLLAAHLYSKNHGGKALVVYENGSLLAEYYDNGFPVNGVADIQSCTKSFSGTMFVQLVKDGLLSSLDQKVADVVTEWQTASLYPAKRDATFRQLLSMTSGLAPALAPPPPGEAGTPLPYDTAINLPMPLDQVGSFRYGPASFMVFGKAIENLTRPLGYLDPVDYLRRRILSPQAILVADVDMVPDTNDPDIAGGAHMTARMLAKYGEWFRNRLSDPLYAELVQPSPTFENYGISWWRTLGAYDEPNVPVPGNGFIAKGAGDNRLYVMPGLNAVVARLADDDPEWSDVEFMDRLLG